MILTSDNYLTFAAHHYCNEQCESDAEFREDLDRVIRIYRSLRRYGTKSFNPRLLMNQIVTFYNVFEPRAASDILIHKAPDEDLRDKMKACLAAMDLLPVTFYYAPYIPAEIYQDLLEEKMS